MSMQDALTCGCLSFNELQGPSYFVPAWMVLVFPSTTFLLQQGKVDTRQAMVLWFLRVLLSKLQCIVLWDKLKRMRHLL